MTLKALALAAFTTLMATSAATAATVTVDGADYDVSTITGTFKDNRKELESQIWWGDERRAVRFASTLGSSLGSPNGGAFGPYFAYSFVSATGTVSAITDFSGTIRLNNSLDTSPLTFAVAAPVSAVPLPAGGLLLLTGLGAVAVLKRRKQRA